MTTLALIRHGQSKYNLENIFTGWLDVDLTPKGEEEARKAAAALRAQNFTPERAYTSALKRAQRTLDIILQDAGFASVPVVRDAALNERHYGELQGKNKAETASIFGADQVHVWRRSYDIAPPGGESLKDTAARTIPYFKREIEPKLREGDDVLIVAHGNSLRSIVMEIERLTPDQILKTEIATGEAYLYEFADGVYRRQR